MCFLVQQGNEELGIEGHIGSGMAWEGVGSKCLGDGRD